MRKFQVFWWVGAGDLGGGHPWIPESADSEFEAEGYDISEEGELNLLVAGEPVRTFARGRWAYIALITDDGGDSE